MNREIIMTALLNRLTAAPMIHNFRADTVADTYTLTNVDDSTGLMVGMPVIGDGLPADAIITGLSPLTISLPAIANRTNSTMTQGFQTVSRRAADPQVEQDMPALYLVEIGEIHPSLPVRGSNQPELVELHCEAVIYTKAGADRNAVPAIVINNLIDSIERALYPTPVGFRQTLGVNGVLFARIEGEVQKDAGHDSDLAGAVIPIKIVVAASDETYVIVPPGGALTWDAGGFWDDSVSVWDPAAMRMAA